MIVTLDLDDGSVLANQADLIDKLKEHYPQLKLSLFFIPYDYEYEINSSVRVLRPQKLKWLKDRLGWIELIPHGITHIPREFEKADTQTMDDYVNHIHELFEADGLPFVKGFKAPQWLWNKEVVDVLDKYDWFGASDRNQPNMVRTKRDFQYDYSIDEDFLTGNKLDITRLHGHMTKPSNNDLESCMLNLMRIPQEWEFKFVSEVV